MGLLCENGLSGCGNGSSSGNPEQSDRSGLDHGNRGDLHRGCRQQAVVRFWADDTLAVYFNDALLKAPEFGQNTCANQAIGCEPNEFWDLNATTTGGLDTLRLVAYQVGSGDNTTDNPFGVLYSGSVPELISTMSLGCRPGGLRCASLASAPQRLIATRPARIRVNVGRPIDRTALRLYACAGVKERRAMHQSSLP